MSLIGRIDLGGTSADQVEKEASGVTPGWYRATVSDVYSEDGNLCLQFTLADGRKHTEKLWDPAASEKPHRLQQRRDAFSIRLGLVPREAKGTAYEFSWLDAMGRECIVHLTLSKPNAKGQQFVNLDWMGLFAADDPRALEHLPKGGQPAAAETAAAVSPAREPAPEPTAPRQSSFSLDDL